MVFQHYALYPHMTVRENMAFGLRNIAASPGRDRRAASTRPRACWRSSRCSSASPASFPAASASAWRSAARSSRSPKAVPVRRAAVQSRCGAARPHPRRAGAAAPAAARDDDLRHPRPGRGDDAGRPHRGDEPRPIEQIGTPMEIYGRPATRFVAGFVGTPAMNFLPVSDRRRRRPLPPCALPDGDEIVHRRRLAA